LINGCIKRPIDSKLIVTGPPGSGKTFITVERIKFLTENYVMDDPRSLMVLSFTRNAVREIKSRLRQINTCKYEYVTIQTFDQFAFQLLLNTIYNLDLLKIGRYEKNIKDATEIIREKHILDEENEVTLYDLNKFESFFKIKHIIIDEIQDLNLNRAELVWELLKYLDQYSESWGFTLLGDLDQEIFAYMENMANELSQFKRSIDFISRIKNWADNSNYINVEEIQLNSDFKCNRRFVSLNKQTQECIEYVRSKIHENSDEKNVDRQSHFAIKLKLPMSPEINSIKSFIEIISQNRDMKTALLFRNNRTAGYVSSILYQNAFSHLYQLSNAKRVYPSWIGYIIPRLAPIRNNKDFLIEKENFFVEWQELQLSKSISLDPKQAWQILSYITSHGHQLDLNKIYLSILRKNIISLFDESLLDEFGVPNSNFTVSTIHKSKGREYDIVFCENFDVALNKLSLKEIQNENRVIYVALTRCKHKFLLLNFINDEDGKPFRLDTIKHLVADNRQNITQIFEKKRNLGLIIEDITILDKASFLTKRTDIANARQNYIWKNVKIGDEIFIKLTVSDNKNWKGFIFHKNNEIGNLTDEISNKIGKKLKKVGRNKYEIHGGKIVALTTELISHRKESTKLQDRIPWKYLDLGFWIGFRIMGLLYIYN